jgi:hypothetical protein
MRPLFFGFRYGLAMTLGLSLAITRASVCIAAFLELTLTRTKSSLLGNQRSAPIGPFSFPASKASDKRKRADFAARPIKSF